MTLFDELYHDMAIPLFQEHLGEEQCAVYTPSGGAGVHCTAIVGQEAAREEETTDGRMKRRERYVWLSAREVCSPQITATLTFGEEVWSVETVEAAANLHKLNVVRLEALERSRPHLRRRR